jgi:hypothetical protein
MRILTVVNTKHRGNTCGLIGQDEDATIYTSLAPIYIGNEAVDMTKSLRAGHKHSRPSSKQSSSGRGNDNSNSSNHNSRSRGGNIVKRNNGGSRKLAADDKSGVETKTKVVVKAKKVSRSPEQYLTDFHKLKAKIKHWHSYFEQTAAVEKERSDTWDTLDTLQSELCHKYAWAVPDARSLRIIANFSPLVEIGCGKGLWAKLLEDLGADIVGFDKFVDLTDVWTPSVQRGGPEKLLKSASKGRTLFLCYPDEMESVASECLDNFSGEYIIHVGELMVSGGTLCGAPTAPFGRTTSADFQVKLAANYHCVLMAQLLHTYPNSRDCVSVWKRTHFIIRKGQSGDEASEGDDDTADEDESDGKDEEDDDEDDDGEEDDDEDDDGEEDDDEGDDDDEDDDDEDNDEEDEDEDTMKPLPKLDAADCEFISMADLAKLRGDAPTKSTQNRKPVSAESTDMKTSDAKPQAVAVIDCEYMSIADLQKLRAEDTESRELAGKKRKMSKEITTNSKEKTVKAAKVVSLLRELLLDNQYDECGDTTWASIPATELLPVDCAIPSLRHLLDTEDLGCCDISKGTPHLDAARSKNA